MKKLTLKETIKKHVELWTWIANKTLEEKRVVRKEEYFKIGEEIPLSHCFCCEYDEQNGGNCLSCPLNWGGYEKRCSDDVVYLKWCIEKDYKKSAKLARKIAHISLKPEFAKKYELECMNEEIDETKEEVKRNVKDENDAIEIIKSNMPTSGYHLLREALNMAIEALEYKKNAVNVKK